MIRRPFSLLLLGCSACASNSHEWRLEGTAGSDERAAIQTSFGEWCERSDGKHCDTITGDGDSKITMASTWHPGTMGQLFVDVSQDGSTASAEIRLRTDRDKPDWLERLRRVTLHELGHWYRDRSGHLGPGNVMAPCYGDIEHLTDADLTDEYQDIEGCGGS